MEEKEGIERESSEGVVNAVKRQKDKGKRYDRTKNRSQLRESGETQNHTKKDLRKGVLEAPKERVPVLEKHNMAPKKKTAFAGKPNLERKRAWAREDRDIQKKVIARKDDSEFRGKARERRSGRINNPLKKKKLGGKKQRSLLLKTKESLREIGNGGKTSCNCAGRGGAFEDREKSPNKRIPGFTE